MARSLTGLLGISMSTRNNYPGMSNFQKQSGGKSVTLPSAIVPFAKNAIGQPVGKGYINTFFRPK